MLDGRVQRSDELPETPLVQAPVPGRLQLACKPANPLVLYPGASGGPCKALALLLAAFKFRLFVGRFCFAKFRCARNAEKTSGKSRTSEKLVSPVLTAAAPSPAKASHPNHPVSPIAERRAP